MGISIEILQLCWSRCCVYVVTHVVVVVVSCRSYLGMSGESRSTAVARRYQQSLLDMSHKHNKTIWTTTKTRPGWTSKNGPMCVALTLHAKALGAWATCPTCSCYRLRLDQGVMDYSLINVYTIIFMARISRLAIARGGFLETWLKLTAGSILMQRCNDSVNNFLQKYP